jgi:hypothetical protein
VRLLFWGRKSGRYVQAGRAGKLRGRAVAECAVTDVVAARQEIARTKPARRRIDAAASVATAML